MNIGVRVVVLALVLVILPSLAQAAKTHRVAKKDSLYSLARKYHVTVEDIKSANNLVSSHLKPGEKLIIPRRTISADDRRDSGSETRSSAYKVKKGDTLFGIARKTGVSVASLKHLNGISGKKLKPGSILALREADPAPARVAKSVRSYSVKNTELFSDKEYERTLAELTDGQVEKPIELAKEFDLNLPSDASKKLKKSAFSFLGARYRFGGTSRNSLDCSSFVQQVFRELQISLPRTAREQFRTGEPVSYELQKGDLVFFRTYASFPSHVGIYLGDNKMIHASSRDRKVVISSMDTPYYRSRFIGAKRYPTLNPESVDLQELFADTEVLEESAADVVKNDALGLHLVN
jgi:peptidoglycan DL-endopeptidase LytE